MESVNLLPGCRVHETEFPCLQCLLIDIKRYEKENETRKENKHDVEHIKEFVRQRFSYDI